MAVACHLLLHSWNITIIIFLPKIFNDFLLSFSSFYPSLCAHSLSSEGSYFFSSLPLQVFYLFAFSLFSTFASFSLKPFYVIFVSSWHLILLIINLSRISKFSSFPFRFFFSPKSLCPLVPLAWSSYLLPCSLFLLVFCFVSSPLAGNRLFLEVSFLKISLTSPVNLFPFLGLLTFCFSRFTSFLVFVDPLFFPLSPIRNELFF